MTDFFSNNPSQPLEWFGLTHILLTLGFIATVIVLWIIAPKIGQSKYEKWFRYFIIALGIIFEWRVFESRILTGSIFRMPLCAVALYSLMFSVAFKKEKIFKIGYFFAFGSLLSFLFFDTPWGLDRWDGWTFFGAHAVIAWLAVYGLRALKWVPSKKDLIHAFEFMAIYAFISGYAFLRFGGADELFLFTPPVDFLVSMQQNSEVLYLGLFSLFAATLVLLMYVPVISMQKKAK